MFVGIVCERLVARLWQIWLKQTHPGWGHSLSGTITYGYDNLDRLTNETTPQGSVSYTYDAAGRRTSMTVAGHPTVNCAYDNADRLTQITQGSSTVTIVYDANGRRTSVTLPNGVVTEYGYDLASHLTSLTYKQAGNVIGDLTYDYDERLCAEENTHASLLSGTAASKDAYSMNPIPIAARNDFAVI